MKRFFTLVIALVVLVCSFSLSQAYDVRNISGLLSDTLSSDPAVVERAADFIREKRPRPLAEELKKIALTGSNHDRRKKAFEALKFYPPNSITEVWIEFIEKSGSFVMKTDAIEYLSSYNSRALVVPFAKELSSRYQGVREAAARGLSRYADDRVFPFILMLAESSDPVVRIYALEAMYHLYDTRLSSAINQLLRDPNHSVRVYAVKCAVKNNLTNTLNTIRSLARADESVDVRVAAIEALGDMGDRGALNIISYSINDDSRQIRFKSAESAYKIGSHNAAGFLTLRLSHEDDEEIIDMILECLIQFRRAGALQPIEDVLSGSSNVDHRIKTAYLLGIIRNDRAVSLLSRALLDRDHRVRAEACASMGKYRGRNSMNELLNIVRNDRIRYVRSAALYSIKGMNDRSALVPLFEVFADENDPVFRIILQRVIAEMIGRYT